jgi:diguanylate cyclase (GGDEF)-like protein
MRRRSGRRREGSTLLRRIGEAPARAAASVGEAVRRRAVRLALRAAPAVAILLGAAAVVRGEFARPALRPVAWLGLALLAVAAGWAGIRRARRSGEGRGAALPEQLEIGGLLAVAAAAVAQLSAAGPEEVPLFPLVYVATAVAVAFLSRAAGLAAAGLAALLQLGAWWARGAAGAELPGVAARVTFVVLFALLYHAVLWARLAAARHAERTAVEARLREIDERARELRLLAPGAGEAGDEEERARERARAAVVEVEAAMRGALEVAEVALRAHTCAVFLLSPDDRRLQLRECRSRSDCVARGPIPAREGVLGSVVGRATKVRLHGDIRSATYYADGTRPRALVAAPLVDRRGGHVRGVIVADRLDDQPFGEADEELLERVAGELIRAVASERLLVDLTRARDEKQRFYDAIERLNRTTTPAQVFEAVLEVAEWFAPVDFGAVTLVSEGEGKRRHEVVRAASGAGGERRVSELEGISFADNAGLVSAAVRLGSALPGTDIRVADALLLDGPTRLRGISSLKILPLKTGEKVLGTLVLGSRRERAFGRDAVRQLEVLAMQAADALLRARLFEQTERLATTDGLTGLANHRTFQARLDEHLAGARRYGKRLSLVLCDVDHFKSVNDTHGHPVGDQVLQGVARVLAREARGTDLAARYGGEEFAVAMPETDAAGARVIAERIRTRLADTVFATELGPLRVTLSVGIATFPDDGRTKAGLMEAADACLYQAKRGGRNRTVAAGDARGARASLV